MPTTVSKILTYYLIQSCLLTISLYFLGEVMNFLEAVTGHVL